MVMSSKKTEAAPPARAVTAPRGWKGTPVSVLAKRTTSASQRTVALKVLATWACCRQRRRTWEVACFNRPVSGSEKPSRDATLFAKGAPKGCLPNKKSGPCRHGHDPLEGQAFN